MATNNVHSRAVAGEILPPVTDPRRQTLAVRPAEPRTTRPAQIVTPRRPKTAARAAAPAVKRRPPVPIVLWVVGALTVTAGVSGWFLAESATVVHAVTRAAEIVGVGIVILAVLAVLGRKAIKHCPGCRG